MDNSLVVWFDGGCVMKNDNFRLEIVHRFGVDAFVKENHTFAEARALQRIFFDHAFDGEADSLPCESFFNDESFVMDGLHLDWFEDASFVWPEV